MINVNDFYGSKELFDGRYKLIRPLSTDGGTADVWLAIDTNTIDSYSESDNENDGVEPCLDENSGMLVAIKIYRPKNALDVEGEQRFREEYKIVYECRHANLLQPTSFSIFQDTPYLVLPYCKFGSSEQLIGKKLTNDTIWKYILDVSSGLNRLHENDPQIIHQDIKPANVLIDNSRNFAITDFGISSKRGGPHGYLYDEENSGTLAYMAPERFQEDAEPIAQSDIWAFGATLCEILTGKVPFGEDGGFCQASKHLPMPPIPNVPADFQRLIHDCLSLEPGNRPSAAKIKEAAQARQYPIKSKKWVAVFGAAIAAIVLAVLFIHGPEPATSTIQYGEIFENARNRLDSNNADSLKLGVSQMDSLCDLNYIPALYEMAFTYGWYSDPKSLKRKELLGIEVCDSGDEKYFPKLDQYSTRAVGCLQKILALNDSSYADINAQAAYRLACYYGVTNRYYKQNDDQAKYYLGLSLEWAKFANDSVMVDKVNKGLAKFY